MTTQKDRPTDDSDKLDLVLDMLAQEIQPHDQILGMIKDVKERQDEHIADNVIAHDRLEGALTAVDGLITGNGGVGIAEEVRVLKRGYRAVLWLGGTAVAAIIVQTVVIVSEAISS